MPPKRTTSGGKKKTKKQLEEEEREREREAEEAAAALRAAQEAALLAEEAARRREEDEMRVQESERVVVEHHAAGDVSAVVHRTFAGIFKEHYREEEEKKQREMEEEERKATEAAAAAEAAAEAAAAAAAEAEAAASRPASSNRRKAQGSSKKSTLPSRSANSDADNAGSRRSTGNVSQREGGDDVSASTSKSSSAGKKKKAARSSNEGKKLAAAEQAAREAEEAEQRAAEEAARLEAERIEAARMEAERLPTETESAIHELKKQVVARQEYTSVTEAAILAYYDAQADGDAAEAERLMKEYNLMAHIDIPDDQRRLKEKPLNVDPYVPSDEEDDRVPTLSFDLPQSGRRTSPSSSAAAAAAARGLSSASSIQVLSASGLVDLQAILDRQLARRAAKNDPIKFSRPPVPPSHMTKTQRKRQLLKAALDTGAHKKEEFDELDAQINGEEDATAPSRRKNRSTVRVPPTLPTWEQDANRRILNHMLALQSFPLNPRYDERHERMGGPGAKGMNKEVTKRRKQEREREEKERVENVMNKEESELPATLPRSSSSLSSTLKADSTDSQAARRSCLASYPQEVWFTSETIPGNSYSMYVEIRNIGTLSRRIRLESSSSQYFKVDQPIYSDPTRTKKDETTQFGAKTALLAPGMSCWIGVTFMPDARVDYASDFTVYTETGHIVVPLYACRPKASLSLSPALLDVGVAPSGGRLVRHVWVRNRGECRGCFWLMDQQAFERLESTRQIRRRAALSPRHRPMLVNPNAKPSLFTTNTNNQQPLFTSKAMIDALLLTSDIEQREDFTELVLASGIFRISPAKFELDVDEGVQLRIEFDPNIAVMTDDHDARSDSNFSDASYSLHRFCEQFLLVQDNTSVSIHEVRGSTCDLRVEAVEVDGVELEQRNDMSAAPSSSSSSIDGLRGLSNLVFPETGINSAVARTIRFQNNTPLPVPFHWKVEGAGNMFDQHSLNHEAGQDAPADDGGSYAFNVTPQKGLFPAHSVMDFTFSFAPTSQTWHRAQAKFVVEDVPNNNNTDHTNVAIDERESIEPNRMIRGDTEEEKVNQAERMLDDVTDRLASTQLAPIKLTHSVTNLDYFTLTLSGLGIGAELELSPSPLMILSDPIPLDTFQPQQRRFILHNKSSKESSSGCEATFEFRSNPNVAFYPTPGVSDFLCQDDETSKQQQDGESFLHPALAEWSITPSSGSLKPGESIDVTLNFTPKYLGEYRVELECVVPSLSRHCIVQSDSATSIDMLSNSLRTSLHFRTSGPSLSLRSLDSVGVSAPFLDFGLVNFGIDSVSCSRTILIRNQHPSTYARWSLVEKGQKPMPFLSLRNDDTASLSSIQSNPTSPLSIATEADKQSGVYDGDDIEECDGGLLRFSPARGILPPSTEQVVTVTFIPASLAALKSHIILHWAHCQRADALRLECRGFVQAPILAVTPCAIQYDMSVYTQVDEAEEKRKRIQAEKERAEEEERQRQKLAEEEAAAAAKAAAAKAEMDALNAAWAAAAEEERKAKAAIDALLASRKKLSASQKRELAELEKTAAAASERTSKAAALALGLASEKKDDNGNQSSTEDAAKQTGSQLASPKSNRSHVSATGPTPSTVVSCNGARVESSSSLCVRVPRTFEVKLSNLSNLPAVYRWSIVGNGSSIPTDDSLSSLGTSIGGNGGSGYASVNDGTLTPATPSLLSARRSSPYDVRFYPSHGSLSGREEIVVQITLTAYKSGPLHLLLSCDIDGVAKPLGVEIKAVVKDLTVSYHTLTMEEEKAMVDELKSRRLGGIGLKRPKHTQQFRPTQQSATSSACMSPTGFASPGGQSVFSFGMGNGSVSGMGRSRSSSPNRSGMASPSMGALSCRSSMNLNGSRSPSHPTLRSARTDYSTADGRAKLESRVQVFDQFLPVKQVHSKITTEAEAEAEDEDYAHDMDADQGSESDAESNGSSSPAHRMITKCIVPTPSSLPVLDFGRSLTPGSKVTLPLVLRNHTLIPAKFSVKVMKLRPVDEKDAAAAATQEATHTSTAKALHSKKSRVGGAAVGSASAAAKRLSATANATSTSSLHEALAATFSNQSATSLATQLRSTSHSTMGRRSSTSSIHGGPAHSTASQLERPVYFTSNHESDLLFQSPEGQTKVKQMKEQEEDRSRISPNQGAAILLNASHGVLEPYSLSTIHVTFISDACGRFDDEVLIHVRGLGPIRVALRACVSGMPLRFSPTTPGILFADSPAAARNTLDSIQKAQDESKSRDTEDGDASDALENVGSLQRENGLLLRADAKFVVHGFDRYPKLFFRPILVSNHSSTLAPSNNASSNADTSMGVTSSSFTRRLQYTTSIAAASTGPGHVVTDDQIRYVTIVNSGSTDIKVVWKPYDLRKIAHDKLVDINIRPRAEIEVIDEDEPNQHAEETEHLVDIDVSKYVYPSAQTIQKTHTPSDLSRPSSARQTDAADALSSIPFVLDPPELIIPARGTAVQRISYDPVLARGPDAASQPTHDLAFLDSDIFVAQPQRQHSLTDTTHPAAYDASSMMAEGSKAERKISKVIDEIHAFENRVGRQKDADDLSSDDEESNAAARKPAGILSTHSSSQLTSPHASTSAARVAQALTGPPPTVWLAAPAELSRHPFRLVISARSIHPELKVDKSKGRIKFVAQALTQAMTTTAEEKEDVDVRPTNSDKSKSRSGTMTVHAHVSSPAATRTQRAQLTFTKLLPLSNPTDTTLTFHVDVTPAAYFSIHTPPASASTGDKQQKKLASVSSGGKKLNSTGVTSRTALLPPASQLGWTQTISTPSSHAAFTLLPGASLVLPIRLVAPPPSHTHVWPLVPKASLEGRVSIKFSNGTQQTIPIMAELLRPMLRVEPGRHDFGFVHTASGAHGQFGMEEEERSSMDEYERGRSFQSQLRRQRFQLSLINPSLVDAEWRLVHLPRTRPLSGSSLRGRSESMATSVLRDLRSHEFDVDADALDDPNVFRFDKEGGIVAAGAGSMSMEARALPSGVVTQQCLQADSLHTDKPSSSSLHPTLTLSASNVPAVIPRVPQRLQVTFRPKLKARYFSRFRIEVMHAAQMAQQIDIELRGEGAYDEHIPMAY